MLATGDLDRNILVVKTGVLLKDNYFNGFLPAEKFDFEQRILANYEWMPRRPAETNPEYKQPIVYAAVVNLALKKVFAYERARKNKDYGEKRLQGKWTWGVGGHIEKSDAESGNPIIASAKREMGEEIDAHILNMSILGYINDDANDVGRVHFGMLYMAETGSEKVLPISKEISRGSLEPISELERMCSSKDIEVDSWGRIALGPLKSLLAR